MDRPGLARVPGPRESAGQSADESDTPPSRQAKLVNGSARWFGLRPWRTAAALLLIGLAIREAFSFWTGHPYDLEVWIRTGHAVAQGSNPYIGWWPVVTGASFGYPHDSLYSAAYLPFWPDVFGGSFWLWEHVGGGNRFVLYFLLKQGPIAGDLAIAVLLYRYVLRETGDRAAALGALAFWSFFPYDIMVSAIWGQLDSVTTAVILAALLTSEAQAARRSLAWGVGIFVKWITVVFLPLELFRERGLRRLWAFGSLLVVGGLTVVAFAAAGWSLGTFEAGTLSSAAGGGGGMNYVQLAGLWFFQDALNSTPWSYSVLAHLWIPAAILAGWFGARWVRSGGPGQQLRAFLFVLGAILLVRWGLYEQYMLYPFALLAADVYTRHPMRRAFFYFLTGLAVVFFLVNGGAGIWFAAPASQQAFDVVQSFDSSPFWGPIRSDALDFVSVLVTVTLAQLLVVLWKDDPAPRPWLLPRWPVRRRAPEILPPSGSQAPAGP